MQRERRTEASRVQTEDKNTLRGNRFEAMGKVFVNVCVVSVCGDVCVYVFHKNRAQTVAADNELTQEMSLCTRKLPRTAE